jgi:hypothetical protein
MHYSHFIHFPAVQYFIQVYRNKTGDTVYLLCTLWLMYVDTDNFEFSLIPILLLSYILTTAVVKRTIGHRNVDLIKTYYKFYSKYFRMANVQGVNKYIFQRSMVERWVQSDHILLIHPCSETLPFGTKGHRIFREDA